MNTADASATILSWVTRQAEKADVRRATDQKVSAWRWVADSGRLVRILETSQSAKLRRRDLGFNFAALWQDAIAEYRRKVDDDQDDGSR